MVRPGERENPAHPILRKVINNKSANDKTGLEAYEYENYSKIEMDIINMSDRFKNQKLVQNIQNALDSMRQLKGDQGQPILPVFISETISQLYIRNNPALSKEKVLKTRIKGVGVENGGVVSQLLGSSLQDYNFYDNWLNFLDKKLVPDYPVKQRDFGTMYVEKTSCSCNGTGGEREKNLRMERFKKIFPPLQQPALYCLHTYCNRPKVYCPS